MRKRTILLIAGVLIAGAAAYSVGYMYMYEKPQTLLLDLLTVQKAIMHSDESSSVVFSEYYLLKIDKKVLNIYKMPENILYDSVNLSSLQLSGEEYASLSEGITFDLLSEVYEFLENSMS